MMYSGSRSFNDLRESTGYTTRLNDARQPPLSMKSGHYNAGIVAPTTYMRRGSLSGLSTKSPRFRGPAGPGELRRMSRMTPELKNAFLAELISPKRQIVDITPSAMDMDTNSSIPRTGSNRSLGHYHRMGHSTSMMGLPPPLMLRNRSNRSLTSDKSFQSSHGSMEGDGSREIQQIMSKVQNTDDDTSTDGDSSLDSQLEQPIPRRITSTSSMNLAVQQEKPKMAQMIEHLQSENQAIETKILQTKNRNELIRRTSLRNMHGSQPNMIASHSHPMLSNPGVANMANAEWPTSQRSNRHQTSMKEAAVALSETQGLVRRLSQRNLTFDDFEDEPHPVRATPQTIPRIDGTVQGHRPSIASHRPSMAQSVASNRSSTHHTGGGSHQSSITPNSAMGSGYAATSVLQQIQSEKEDMARLI